MVRGRGVCGIAYCDSGFVATKAQRHKEVSVSLVCLAACTRKASFAANPACAHKAKDLALSWKLTERGMDAR
jgi:hypothetical protein